MAKAIVFRERTSQPGRHVEREYLKPGPCWRDNWTLDIDKARTFSNEGHAKLAINNLVGNWRNREVTARYFVQKVRVSIVPGQTEEWPCK